VEIPDRERVDVVPAGAEDRADRIFAGGESVGDVVGGVEDAAVVVRERGFEDAVADFPAVEVEVVVAETGHVSAGALRFGFEVEGLAEHRGGGSGGCVGRNPLCVPVGGLE
jgi:hypothetical protein